MNRYHMIIIFYTLIAVPVLILGIQSFQTARYRDACRKMKEAVEISCYAAADRIGDTNNEVNRNKLVVDSFFNTMSFITGRDTAELYYYIPVVIILSENGYQVCTYNGSGFDTKETGDIYAYEYDGQLLTLTDSNEELISNVVQECVENSIRQAMDIFCNHYYRETPEININYNFLINPKQSVIAVCQNIPLNVGEKRYSYICQGIKTIERTN